MTHDGSGTRAPTDGRHRRRRKPAPDGDAATRKHGFRPDVEGLRAIAVLLVLLYHAELTGLPGGFVGVDVFFVISGFLITTQLLNELDRRGTVSLTNFYARRAKRLLPAAAVVLVATTLMTLTMMPRHRWAAAGGDIVSAALYVVNWRFAERSVDYLAEGIKPSPVQHFWSLAVEEQFYLVWPLLLLGAALLARRVLPNRGSNRLFLGAALAAVAVPSFVWSVSHTGSTPAKAFFVTTTRMWELAIGAAVAVAAVLLPKVPRAAALFLGWAGVATIVAVGATVSPSTAWPGWAAALPVLGAAAVIAAGPAAGPYGPVALIGTGPFRWVGGLSYSLYLWHWPMLVVAEERWEGLTTGGRLLVVAASFVPAWLTLKLVENPVRFSAAISRRPRLALGIGANCTALGAAAGLVLGMAVSATTPPAPPMSVVAQQNLGAATLASTAGRVAATLPVDFVSQITPDPAVADKDVPDIYELGCQVSKASVDTVACYFGPEKAATTIAVVGDSKAGQWLPALQLLAMANDWRVITYNKASCAVAAVDMFVEGERYTNCRQWADSVTARLIDGPDEIDFVVTSQAYRFAIGRDGVNREAMRDGLAATWTRLTQAGIRVIALADNPHPEIEVWQCASENLDRLSACAFDRSVGTWRSAAPVQRAAVLAAGGRVLGPTGHVPDGFIRPVYVDLVDAICPAATCPPVIGSVMVYRQGSHLTATYVATLAPRLEHALRAAGVPSARPATGQATLQADGEPKAAAATAVRTKGRPVAEPGRPPKRVTTAAKAPAPAADKGTARTGPGGAGAGSRSGAKADAKGGATPAATRPGTAGKPDSARPDTNKPDATGPDTAASRPAPKPAAPRPAAEQPAAPAAPAKPAAPEPAPSTPEPAPAQPSPLGGILPGNEPRPPG